MLTIRYFAAIRERMGRAEEQVLPPEGVETLGALVEWLLGREDVAGLGMDAGLVRVARDAQLADAATPIDGARVIALFPPMTGG